MTRRRWLLAVLAAVAALLAGTVAADGLLYPARDEWEFADWVNGERRWNGRSELLVDGQLTAQAQLQADRMAACQCVFHSPSGELAWFVDPTYNGWTSIGENVGATSGDLYGLHLAFMRSPGHQRNVIDPAYRGVGVAVRRVGGVSYVAEVFAGY